MISRIKGTVRHLRQDRILLDLAGGLSYDVLIPAALMGSLERKAREGESIELITYHYVQSDPSRSVPILIGFSSEIERDFFEKFITVSGVGPKAACRALALPISEIAAAIDSGDLSVLRSLPGIGAQRAREIIAKLQGRVGKFGLIQDRSDRSVSPIGEDIREEALAVLLQLQYKKREAEEMIEKALGRGTSIKTSEDLLNEVYKARHLQAQAE